MHGHDVLSDALQQTPIPLPSNLALKSLLQTGLKILRGHQQRAEQFA